MSKEINFSNYLLYTGENNRYHNTGHVYNVDTTSPMLLYPFLSYLLLIGDRLGYIGDSFSNIRWKLTEPMQILYGPEDKMLVEKPEKEIKIPEVPEYTFIKKLCFDVCHEDRLLKCSRARREPFSDDCTSDFKQISMGIGIHTGTISSEEVYIS